MTAQINKPKFRRTHYFIAKRFQLKYVGLILLLMFLTAALCSYVVYYTSMMLLGEKLANIYPQGKLVSIINTVNFRILLSILLITPVVVVFSIFLSHKIAGPVYRMEKYLRSMSEGNLATPLVLRKGDELSELANGINNLAQSMKLSIGEQRSLLNKMSLEFDTLKKSSTCTDVVTRLEKEIRNLKTSLDKYKT